MKAFLVTGLLPLIVLIANGQNLKSGDLDPNVKILDVDNFISISSEMCIVSKGDKTALIDMSGNFITPWGKFDFLERNDGSGVEQFYYGLVNVRDKSTSRIGFVGKNGSAVIPIKYFPDELSSFYAHGMAVLKNRSSPKTTTYLDNNGAVIFNITEDKYHFYGPQSDNKRYLKELRQTKLFKFSEYVRVGKGYYRFGYMNKEGKIKIQPSFDVANQFSDGMASVGMIDEFGVTKWGFIDSTGKVVIPYKYTIEPGWFHSELALVQANSTSDFKYAYIDKKGEIKFKVERTYDNATLEPYDFDISHSSISRSYPLYKKGSFFNGYSFWYNGKDVCLMDTLGKLSTFKDFLSRHYAVNNTLYFLKDVTDVGLAFTTDIVSEHNNRLKTGIIDLSGKIIYQPVFGLIKPDYFSSNAIAFYLLTDNPAANKKMYRQGIINNEGVFVVIKTEKNELW